MVSRCAFHRDGVSGSCEVDVEFPKGRARGERSISRTIWAPYPLFPGAGGGTFWKWHQLTKHADLSQPGQYACKEQLTIVGLEGRVERVRALGPTRKYTQIEIAMAEQFKLGIHPPHPGEW